MKKQIRKETRQIGALDVRATIVPDSVKPDERSVEIVWGTETPVQRQSWSDGPWFEVLSFDPAHIRMERLNNGVVPLIDNHESWRGSAGVLGSVSNASVSDNQGRATITFADTPDVENTWIKVRDGHIKGVSVGYRIYQLEKVPSADPNTPDKIPTYRATDWEPMEISIAPIPADANSGTRAEADQNSVIIISNKIEDNDTMKRQDIIALLEKRGISVDSTAEDAELLAQLERAMNPTPTPSPAPAAAPAAEPVNVEEVRAAERKRSAEIRTICRKAGISEEITEKYISDNTSVEAVRAAALEKFIAADPSKGAGANPGATRVGEDRERSHRIESIQEHLVVRSGQAPEFKPRTDSDAPKYRHMTLLDLAKDALQRAGVEMDGMSKMDIVGRAFTSSSSDLPVILEGTNRRILLANYEAAADTWRRFCSTGSVSDFREYKRLRMGSFSNLDAVNENGEFKNKKINDAEYEKISASTKGNLINLTRQMIVNDDLGAFARLSAMLGRAAARSIEADVYALLALNSGMGPNMVDGNPLFHSSHANIGTGSALGVAGLDADMVVMASQKDQDDNDFLDIRPQVLLLPKSLESAAKILNASTYDPDATNKLQKPNAVAGMFSDIIGTPRLTGTRRYMFANPAVEPVIEVAFLDGVQAPFMDQQDGFNVDGTTWKIRLDYGVGAVGYKGALVNAGV